MGGGLVAEDFSTDRAGMQDKYASKVRAGFEDTCKYVIPQKRPRTLVLLGCSGNGKSATGNSILRKEAFLSKERAAAVTKECELKTAKRPHGQIINVIDTPGLFSLFPSNESTIREILKCFSLAKEGINALLMVFSLRSRLTEEEKSVLFVLKILFGSDIVNYMIVVFTNEDSLYDKNETMKDYLEECPDFKEILAACNNRMVLFDNRTKASDSKKAEQQVQKLLDLVEVVSKKNKKPFMFDLSHEIMENEAVYEEKQKKIRAMKGHCTKQEMSNWKEEAEKSPQDQLTQMVKKVEIRLKETASMVEQKLTEEKNARLEAEKRVNKHREESHEEIINLKEKLDRARLKETASMLEQKLTEEKNARLEAEKRAMKHREESNEEIKNLKEKLDMARLKETASMLDQKLTEEKNAKLEAEKSANKHREESNEEIKNLKEKLDKAKHELDKKGESCVIL